MAVTLANGSLVHIGSGLGSAIPITAITNDAPAVVSATAHGLSNGDYIVVTSGWSRLDQNVYRVANSTTNDFELEGTDTSNTTIYTPGGGVGSAKEITGWTELQQVLTVTSEGGDQQFATFQFLSADRESRIPTNKAAAGLNITVADDPTLAGFILAKVANDDRVPRPMRISPPNGSKILYFGYITANETPALDVNTPMASQVTMSFVNSAIRYAA